MLAVQCENVAQKRLRGVERRQRRREYRHVVVNTPLFAIRMTTTRQRLRQIGVAIQPFRATGDDLMQVGRLAEIRQRLPVVGGPAAVLTAASILAIRSAALNCSL